ncbi:MAG: amidohydrolase family protein [Myxococcota bacterium]
MVVDAWMQHPTGAFMAHRMFASLRRWMGLPDEVGDVPLATTLGAMDAAGVDGALVSAWCGDTGWLLTNDHVAEVVAQAPTRFSGVGSVDLRDPVEAAREVRRCAERGFVGIRVLPWLWGLPPDDRRYYPVYVACVEAGLPFCTQIGHTGPLRSSEPGRPIPYLERVLLDFPELVVVGGHVGAPWIHEVLSLLHKFPRFHVDTSAYALHRLPAELVTYVKGRGRERVLFGSNYPMLTPAACLERVDELGLDDEARTAFLGGNATRVFGL